MARVIRMGRVPQSRFPVSKGLNGAAVASKRPVIVQDVASDARYLPTIGGTRGEMIYPILRSARVPATIDVESEQLNAFSDEDESLLAACADALHWLWPLTPAPRLLHSGNAADLLHEKVYE